MNWLHRIAGAYQMIVKGSIAPWNSLLSLDAGASEKAFTSPYNQSLWVRSAIKLVTVPMTQVPLVFSIKVQDGWDRIENPELTEWWEYPALGEDKRPMSMSDVIEATVGWLKLKGEAFWIFDDQVLAPKSTLPFPEVGRTLSKLPRFVVVRPDKMAQKTDSTGELVAWTWSDAGGKQHLLDPMQVKHMRFWNPQDYYRGLSEVDPAIDAIKGDFLAGRFKKNLWANSGDRGQIVSVKNAATLTDPQRKQIDQQLREKRELANRGIFKTLILGGDVSVEDPAVQTVDLGFVASRGEDRHAIFLALGVPPSMSEVMASYSVGSASDRFRLIEDTCQPTAQKFLPSIGAIATMQVGGKERIYADLDWKQHSVMQQARREGIVAAQALWAMGMPLEAVSNWLALDLPEFPGWEEGYLPFSVTPASFKLDPESDPSFNEPEDEDEAKPTDDKPDPEDDPSEEKSLSAWNKRTAKALTWGGYARKRAPVAKMYQSKINKVLMAARAEILSKLEGVSKRRGDITYKSNGQVVGKMAIMDVMFSGDDFTNKLLAEMEKATTAAINTAGEQLYGELKLTDQYEPAPAVVQNAWRKRKPLIKNASQEIFNNIKASLSEGIDEGETIQELSARVRAEFNGISQSRARTIAMTETSFAYGEGRQDAMEEAGVEWKEWLTSTNANVRPTHAAAEGQRVRIDLPFTVGGEELMQPGDPNGSAAEVINCHCVAIPVSTP